MEIEVREMVAKAAYHGITRTEIAKRAGISVTIFSLWKKSSPRLTTLHKAQKALEELIVIKGLQNEKVEG